MNNKTNDFNEQQFLDEFGDDFDVHAELENATRLLKIMMKRSGGDMMAKCADLADGGSHEETNG